MYKSCINYKTVLKTKSYFIKLWNWNLKNTMNVAPTALQVYQSQKLT